MKSKRRVLIKENKANNIKTRIPARFPTFFKLRYNMESQYLSISFDTVRCSIIDLSNELDPETILKIKEETIIPQPQFMEIQEIIDLTIE
jgi:hypothetical protein